MRDIFTVTTLTYAATEETTSKDNAVTPSGSPKTTSVIIPDRNIKPYPNDRGCLKTQK